MNTKRRLAAIVAMAGTLGGCITSPYYAQIFNSRDTQIPVQIWTTDKNEIFTLECAGASPHGGPYDGDQSYQFLATIAPSPREHYDYKGTTVYQASGHVVIPDVCWNDYSYPDGANWITVIRVTQGSHGSDWIFTYDKAGLGCLGQGTGANGFGNSMSTCAKKWVNTGDLIRTVFLKAKY